VKVKVLFFGAAKETLGRDLVELDLPQNTSAANAFEQILAAFPVLREKFGKSLLFAVNQTYADASQIICETDELAIFPPVSGGSETQTEQFKVQNENDFFELAFAPLDVGAIARRVVLPECGATVTLDGYVRRWTRGRETLFLVYEAYEPMALSEMAKVGARAREEFDVASIGIVHRLGRMEIGETSVVIAVAAAHRRAAFAACEWAIAELKRVVPIWKKEFYTDGENIVSAWTAGEHQAH
jgi:molybdopterin converting factor subunit 1